MSDKFYYMQNKHTSTLKKLVGQA